MGQLHFQTDWTFCWGLYSEATDPPWQLTACQVLHGMSMAGTVASIIVWIIILTRKTTLKGRKAAIAATASCTTEAVCCFLFACMWTSIDKGEFVGTALALCWVCFLLSGGALGCAVYLFFAKIWSQKEEELRQRQLEKLENRSRFTRSTRAPSSYAGSVSPSDFGRRSRVASSFGGTTSFHQRHRQQKKSPSPVASRPASAPPSTHDSDDSYKQNRGKKEMFRLH